MSYYNTNNEKGTELRNSRIKASSQEDVILKIFRRDLKLTASKVWRKYPTNNGLFAPPITSIRRAITNLTKKGYLVKTEEMVKGIYGKKEHVYKYTQITIKNN